jgi:hypothetical protein
VGDVDVWRECECGVAWFAGVLIKRRWGAVGDAEGDEGGGGGGGVEVAVVEGQVGVAAVWREIVS